MSKNYAIMVEYVSDTHTSMQTIYVSADSPNLMQLLSILNDSPAVAGICIASTGAHQVFRSAILLSKYDLGIPDGSLEKFTNGK